jgi:hypothetical protein
MLSCKHENRQAERQAGRLAGWQAGMFVAFITGTLIADMEVRML